MAGERCSRSQMRCSGSGCDADQVSPARTRTPWQLRQLRQLQAQSPGSCVNYRPSRRRCVRRHRRRWSRLCIELALCRRVCYALLPHIGVGAASASELLLRANRVRPICCMQSQASDVTGLWNGRRTMQPQPDAMQWLWL